MLEVRKGSGSRGFSKPAAPSAGWHWPIWNSANYGPFSMFQPANSSESNIFEFAATQVVTKQTLYENYCHPGEDMYEIQKCVI